MILVKGKKMIRRKIFPHELIGKDIEVVDSKNPSNVGVKGKIIDETKQTIKVQKQDGQEVVLMKNIITFKLENGEVISGEEIMKRPEERLKR
jgi:ribonuclease P protein subunit POP4